MKAFISGNKRVRYARALCMQTRRFRLKNAIPDPERAPEEKSIGRT